MESLSLGEEIISPSSTPATEMVSEDEISPQTSSVDTKKHFETAVPNSLPVSNCNSNKKKAVLAEQMSSSTPYSCDNYEVIAQANREIIDQGEDEKVVITPASAVLSSTHMKLNMESEEDKGIIISSVKNDLELNTFQQTTEPRTESVDSLSSAAEVEYEQEIGKGNHYSQDSISTRLSRLDQPVGQDQASLLVENDFDIGGNSQEAQSESALIEGPNLVHIFEDSKGDRRKFSATLSLLGLPSDALHTVASFLSPTDCCSFGLCSQAAAKVCRDILHKVRMHGFRCATEIVTAWKMNQHSDAKELSALYTQSGVPIYPHCLGHSYHTLVWRMGIEAQELMEHGAEDTSASNTAEENSTNLQPVDRFFVERYDARAREGLNYPLSYLEEKSRFLLNLAKDKKESSAFSQNRFAVRPTTINHQQPAQLHTVNHGPEPRTTRVSQSASSGMTGLTNRLPRRLKRAILQSEVRGLGPKAIVKVHRHLLDQHLLGHAYIDDKDGTMTTAPLNLSADFFHPTFKVSGSDFTKSSKLSTDVDFIGGETSPIPAHHLFNQPSATNATGGTVGDFLSEPIAGANSLPLGNTPSDSGSEGEPHVHRILDAFADTIFEPRNETLSHRLLRIQEEEHMLEFENLMFGPSAPTVHSTVQSTVDSILHSTVLENVDLDVYSATSSMEKSENDIVMEKTMRDNLSSRFMSYQRRLEIHLSHHDNYSFDECLLDFWDEFFPQTVNIHYYDGSTAVPRVSRLKEFLSVPCPKAIGVVQCEIERIKVGSKKKGVSMKGRFFPTYEYRLFIRHHPPELLNGSEQLRTDTVLMTAKNRSKKQLDSSGSGSSSKKGSNNYFLYLPRQDDINHHFECSNRLDSPVECISNGANRQQPQSKSYTLMGRLQSNFIGTEFQIFTPTIAKEFEESIDSYRGHAMPNLPQQADNEEQAMSSDRRRGRFSRLTLRRNPSESQADPVYRSHSSEDVPTPRLQQGSIDTCDSVRRSRISRRAIANDSGTCGLHGLYPMPLEEENGAITYTANLLGSRPRIMDVCVPKVIQSSSASSEWKMQVEKSLQEGDSSTTNRMLNRLKMIQQRMETEERMFARNAVEAGENNTDSSSLSDDFGLLALQNRPPWWNVELGSFVLNFGGRVSVASVKNFQLCDRNDQEHIMLQFGRIQGRHSFTMDFQYPLTGVQAFAIAISSLQSKLSLG